MFAKRLSLCLFSACLVTTIMAQSPKQKSTYFQPADSDKLSQAVRSFCTQPGTGQDHMNAWIYFTDKQVFSESAVKHRLQTVSMAFAPKAIQRRERVLPPEKRFDFHDLPVSGDYVGEVLKTGAKHRSTSRWLNAISIRATASQIKEIEKLNFVRRITRVMGFERDDVTSETLPDKLKTPAAATSALELNYGQSYGQLHQINVPALHQLGYSGNNVLVCMMDTGYRKDHEAFQQANIVAERDFIFDDDDTQTDPTDPWDSSDSHGTLTWSALGGFMNGKLIGPAYAADFLLAKTEDTRSETPIEEDFWVEGIEWADSLGAQVVSSSLGYTDWYTFADMDGNTAVTTIAADRAARLGIVVVTANGNDRNSSWGHVIAPADGDSVIGVGAVSVSGSLASFSSPGPTYDGRIKPEVCAQGQNTYAASNSGTTSYRTASGTSLSTPLVAGVAALLLEIHPDWTPMQVREALMQTADNHLTPDNDFGWGIIDALAASGYAFTKTEFLSATVDDDTLGASFGNHNLQFDAGEKVELAVEILNKSDVPLTNVSATLTTDDQYVTITSNGAQYGDIEPGATKINDVPFALDLSPELPELSSVLFSLLVHAEGSETDTLQFVLVSARQSWNILGTLVIKGSLQAVTSSELLMTKLLDPSGSLVERDTLQVNDVYGRYSIVSEEGRFVLQPVSDGYLKPDAITVEVNQDISNVNFYFEKPALSLLSDTLKLVAANDGIYSGSVTLKNTGNGDLDVNLFESSEQLPTAVSESIIPKGIIGAIQGHHDNDSERSTIFQTNAVPWCSLRKDANDGLRLDFKALSASHDTSFIYLKLDGYRDWGASSDWVLFVFFGTQQRAHLTEFMEGPAAMIGAYGNYFFGAAPGDTGLISLENVSISDSSISLAIERQLLTASLDNVSLIPISTAIYRAKGETEFFDAIPDFHLRQPYVLYSLYEPRTLPAITDFSVICGEELKLEFSTADQLNPLESLPALIIQSNDPVQPLRLLPIVLVNKTGVPLVDSDNLPDEYCLFANYPNPFNNSTIIRFGLPAFGHVSLDMYNIMGQKIRTLVNENKAAGIHSIEWDGRDDAERPVGSGVYIFKLYTGAFFGARKLLLMK
ncbi:S8 family serine peptidase [candidate division KSB1 bacterium]|nr:S8 family serine peptidase [candidate division KSB1 bacterium]